MTSHSPFSTIHSPFSSGEAMEVRDASPRYMSQVEVPVVPEGYKQTDVGAIPAEWECVQIASLGDGKVPPVKAGPFGSSITKDQYVSYGYKVYGQEQVIRGDYLYGDYFISAEKYRELESCAVRPGDILLSLVGTLGKLLEIPDKAPQGVINPRLLRLSLDRRRILPRFLKYLFESVGVQSRLERQAQGGTMGVLNAGVLQNFNIVLPALTEQRAIATALSDVDSLLESLDRLIAKKRDIKQATMQALLSPPATVAMENEKWRVENGDNPENSQFSTIHSPLNIRLPGFEGQWARLPLGDIVTFLSGGTPSRNNESFWAGDIPWISASTLRTFYICRSDSNVTKEAVAAGSKMAPIGSVLLLVRGSALHNEVLAGLVTKPVCFNQDVKALVPQARLCGQFLTFLMHGRAQDLLKLVSSAGNTAGVLDTKLIKAFEVQLPPLDEQVAIVTILADMDSQLEALQQRRTKTAALKQAMMQELLTGRTRLV